MKHPETVQYWAISVLGSRTMWVGLVTFGAGVLSLPEVAALIPLRYLPAVLAFAGFTMMYLRTTTQRPVAFIPPGATTPVEVPRVGPPAPPVMTD
jgi:hypothetical protein